MGKSFKFKEAKEMIQAFESTITEIKKSENICNDYYGNILTNTKYLATSGFFNDLIKKNVNGKEIDYKDKQINLLIQHVYQYIISKKYLDTCNFLLNSNENQIYNDINNLSGVTNLLTWWIASKGTKLKAENSYSDLERRKNSGFLHQSQETIDAVANIKNTSFEEAFATFKEDRDSFLKEINSIDNNILKEYKGLVNVFLVLKNKYDKIQNSIKTIKENEEKDKDEIKKAIDYVLAEELVNALREIPIEELGREKSGVKIKCLKDAGYNDLAKVFGASIEEISSIYGISRDAAYTIKSICDSYAKEIKKSQKVKFSTDNKTKSSSKVIRLIYLYLKKKEVRKVIDEFNSQYNDKLQKSINIITDVGNGSTWIFESDEYRKKVIDNYNFLHQILNEDFKDLSTQIDNILDYSPTTTSKKAWADFSENSIKYYNTIEEIYPGVLGTDDSIYGLPEQLAREIQDQCYFPDGLLCTLRRYQEWGVKYILHQEKALLGDEMGLGKTIEAIATMVSLKNTGATHFIVVCPASIVTNWCREITKQSKLSVTKIHGAGKTAAFNSWIKTGGVTVTNFESTSILKMDETFKYSLLIVDEAHYLKNPNTRRSENTLELTKHTDRILFMTGTALENKVDKMLNLIYDLNPGIACKIQNIAFMSTAPQFREAIAPVYYRRKREDVLTELPDKIENEEWCDLNPEEEEIYEDAVLEKRYNDARRVSWNIKDLNKSSKATRLKEIIDDAEKDGRKVIVFSFFLDTIFKIHEFLKDKCLNPIYGRVNVNRRQEILDEFEKAPAGTVLLAQITSGGVGLNIQCASVVVICEPQFKPSIENQAISRAYRMGQTRNVLVFRLLAANSIDEKLLNILKEKQEIFNAFADKSVAAEKQAEIDNETFGKIIEEEIDRIKKKRGEELPNSNNKEIEEVKVNEDTKEDKGKDDNDVETYDATNNNQSIQEIDSNKNEYELCENTSSVSYPTEVKEAQILNNNNNNNHKEYYQKLMTYKYDELVSFLLKEHGPAKYDYFTNELCNSKNKKVSRTSEGLYCHHIDEDKEIKLSDDKLARQYPFAYQKADRLVYCNILEHFLLHILIYEKTKNSNTGLGINGAIAFMCPQLNDLYGGYEFKKEWIIRCMSWVKNDYDSYIVMLRRLWDDIKDDKLLPSFITKEYLSSGYNNTLYEFILKDLEKE